MSRWSVSCSCVFRGHLHLPTYRCLHYCLHVKSCLRQQAILSAFACREATVETAAVEKVGDSSYEVRVWWLEMRAHFFVKSWDPMPYGVSASFIILISYIF